MTIAFPLKPTTRWLLNVLLGISSASLCHPAYSATQALTDDNIPSSPASDQRWQHLHQEDTGSSIDEVRVGGETQRLTVQPKSKLLNAPAYEFQPTNGARRSLATGPGADSAGSTRVWNFLSF